MKCHIQQVESTLDTSNVLQIASTALQLKTRHDAAWAAYKEYKSVDTMHNILGAMEWFFIYKQEVDNYNCRSSLVMEELEAEMLLPFRNFSEIRKDYVTEVIRKSRQSNTRHYEYLVKELIKIGYVL